MNRNLSRRIFSILLLLGIAGCGRLWTPYRPTVVFDSNWSDCREAGAGERVEWVSAFPPGEASLDSLWCGTVGGTLVEDHTDAVAAPIDSIAIITWNTHVGGGDIMRFIADLRAGILSDSVPVLQFVILLQEVHREGDAVPGVSREDVIPDRLEYYPADGPRLDVSAVARAAGLWMTYVPSMRNGEPGEWDTEEDRGNAILSTIPLDEVTAVVLPFEKMRRVAIIATATGVTSSGESWRLRICNVHLDNRTQFTRQFGFGGIVGRLRQARALIELIDGPAAIIGGDFNTWAPGPLERSVELVQTDFPQPRRLPRDNTIIARFLPDRRVDYLLFRTPKNNPQSYRRIHDAYGSDHYPLFAMFPVASAVDSLSLQ